MSDNKEQMGSIDHRAILDAFSRIGKVEGRVDSLESRIFAWEKKIEGRLDGIEAKIEELFKALQQGQGIWRVIQFVGWIIVAIPSFILISQLLR